MPSDEANKTIAVIWGTSLADEAALNNAPLGFLRGRAACRHNLDLMFGPYGDAKYTRAALTWAKPASLGGELSRMP